jgi:hypothetical protein
MPCTRNHVVASLLVVTAIGSLGIGCAGAARAVKPGIDLDDLGSELGSVARSGAEPARLPAPDTSIEAQAYLTGAIAALRASQPKHASVFIDAILRSDHLTDRGRANVYWLGAEAHRLAGNERGLVDSLGGFLVAAAVLPHDDDMRVREVEARAALVARRLQADPTLGKSPDEAIPVEDARDAPGIVAELGCVEDSKRAHEALEERRVICRSGAPLVLWFDLTHTRVP